MRLAEPPARNAPADVESAVAGVLDDHLDYFDPRPVAVGLSGGGDSTALLLAAKTWADRAGRRLVAVTVDHRLRAASEDWTHACADLAQRLDIEFRALAWEGPKPVTGLPAAARQARHRLLADAARDAGAAVILLGHTADDVAEAAAMRDQGSTVPTPRVWSPSPAWPEGRGLFILRPLLGIGRAALRSWLAARGQTWIDDPANSDPRSLRAIVRAAGPPPANPVSPPDLRAMAAACVEEPGALALPRSALRAADPLAAERFVSIASLCASGRTRPPRGDALRRLGLALRGTAPLEMTLAGARIEADAEQVRFMREVGRTGLPALALHPDETVVWDGLYQLRTGRSGLVVGPLAGFRRRLVRDDEAALKGVAPNARGVLPAVFDGEHICCPLLNPMTGLSLEPLAHARLLAACGSVEREPA